MSQADAETLPDGNGRRRKHEPDVDQLAVFAPIADLGRADLVAQRLGDAIILGVLQDGDRLPNEANLGQQFGVATVTAREALEMLRSRGLIMTKRGRGGGSFVTYRRSLVEDLDQTQFAHSSRTGLRDMAIHYGALAARAASLAAVRASDDDVERLREIVADLDYGSDVGARRGEALFRVEVAAVAQSASLLKEEVRLQTEYSPVLWVGMGEERCRDIVRNAHEELVAAIESVDEARAAGVVQRQVDSFASFAIGIKARFDREHS